MLEIMLPDYKPYASKRSHAAASAYGNMRTEHLWLLDAINNGTYPPFMNVITGGEKQALAAILRATIEAATHYYDLLDGVTQAAELAREEVSDYIQNLDSIYL